MFPIFPNKHLEKPLFTPTEFLDYLRKVGRYPTFSPPDGIIICYQQTLLDHIIQNHKLSKVHSTFGELYLMDDTSGKIGIAGKIGIGAPAVVTAMEELIAFGVNKFISIGTAGALQKNLKAGDIIICDKAIRDEGVSYHYLAPEKYVYASGKVVENIKRSLEKVNQKFYVGTSWTIDAPYRETIAEAKKYQEEGVLTVEMEAAALLSVAQYRGVEMGAIFTISDSLADLKWDPSFYQKEPQESLEILYKVALQSLQN